MNGKSATVLLGESTEKAKGSIKGFLEKLNIEVLECMNGIEVIQQSFAKNPDLIILDVALPRLNGFMCSRILKSDPLMKATPIIHMGSPQNSIEQYWSRVSGGDYYLQMPFNEADLSQTLRRLLRKESSKRRLLAPVRIAPELEEHTIFHLGANLLEQELLRAKILNEINLMDISSMPTKDFVLAIMTIVSSLYDFTLGAALLLFDPRGEFYFYQNEKMEQYHLDEIKKLIFTYLEQHHGIYLNPAQMRQNILLSSELIEPVRKTGDVYIHTKEGGLTYSVLAFQNIGYEDLREDDQEILRLALDLAHGVLEKKIFFQISQELSIIDGVTEGYSLAFFMEILRREIEAAKRNGFPMTLITVTISNFQEIAKTLNTKLISDLIRATQNVILQLLRKSDTVARWEMASFALLFTYTTAEKALVVQERLRDYLRKALARYLPSSTEILISFGASQYNPERDLTPEIFFSQAKPRKQDAQTQTEELPMENDLFAP